MKFSIIVINIRKYLENSVKKCRNAWKEMFGKYRTNQPERREANGRRSASPKNPLTTAIQRGGVPPLQGRKFNALTGEEMWNVDVSRQRRSESVAAGRFATPAIRKGSLGDLVYFNLSRVQGGGGGLGALNKETGGSLADQYQRFQLVVARVRIRFQRARLRPALQFERNSATVRRPDGRGELLHRTGRRHRGFARGLWRHHGHRHPHVGSTACASQHEQLLSKEWRRATVGLQYILERRRRKRRGTGHICYS